MFEREHESRHIFINDRGYLGCADSRNNQHKDGPIFGEASDYRVVFREIVESKVQIRVNSCEVQSTTWMNLFIIGVVSCGNTFLTGLQGYYKSLGESV